MPATMSLKNNKYYYKNKNVIYERKNEGNLRHKRTKIEKG